MDSAMDSIAPKTNPDVGKPARVARTVAQRPEAKTHIAGSALVPDIAGRRDAAGVARRFRYWVGITPSTPVESIDLAGVNFPKVNELLVPDPMRTSVKRRVPVIGAIVWLDEAQIQRMRERLPRTIIRFTSTAAQKDEPGTGQNIGDVHAAPRRGQLITIPTASEIAQRRKTGKATREYIPNANDVPAARFMFAQLCDDQVNGSRGSIYPEALETTGLEWPDELSDLLS